MPDIRVILEALSPEDRQLWAQCRTEIKRSYILAHNSTLGLTRWDIEDDAFMDLIDIKLATLFDRAGKLSVNEGTLGILSEADQLENDIIEQSKRLAALKNGSPSAKLLPKVEQNNSWGK